MTCTQNWFIMLAIFVERRTVQEMVIYRIVLCLNLSLTLSVNNL